MKLSEIKTPEELISVPVQELEEMASEARKIIVSTVSANGGHLAPNLGMVELTLSLYHVFDFSKDKLIFDVGHQCYVHKLLTGRYDAFESLRLEDGISGFPRQAESPYDLFNTGHSSSSLSLADGLALSRDLSGENYNVVCVVGDGAMTGGMAYEALNDIGNRKTRVIIILNDNGMSISGNVGALNNYLTYLRLSKGWQNVKGNVSKFLLKVPFCGKKLHDVFLGFKDHLRNIFINDKFFSCLGIRYIGPVDGHDIRRLSMVLNKAQMMNEPVLIHVMTKKGKGLPEAEKNPENYHNIPPAGQAKKRSAGQAVCEHLTALAQKNDRIAVITAAMTGGTGFSGFRDRFPDRLFDVGIAEEHAVTMAAGLAKGGMRPFVAVYDTFFQRAYDQIMEDVCCQGLPVMFLADRAEFSEQDGMTHQGVYGGSFFRTIPGLQVFCPLNETELMQMIDWALLSDKPAVFRYPKAFSLPHDALPDPFVPGKWHPLLEGKDAHIFALGNIVSQALAAADILQKKGVSISVIGADSLRPIDENMLRNLCGKQPCFTVEENQRAGGFGSAVLEFTTANGLNPPRCIALPNDFFIHGSRESFLKKNGLSGDRIAACILEEMGR